MKTLIRHFKKVNGQSLAEFAVTTAMMATLATTAAPKFSGVGEGAKEKKTLADIDKILKSANNFYNEQVTKAGRGRFPGQWKYNEAVPSGGGYTYDEVNGGQDDAEYQVKLAVKVLSVPMVNSKRNQPLLDLIILLTHQNGPLALGPIILMLWYLRSIKIRMQLSVLQKTHQLSILPQVHLL